MKRNSTYIIVTENDEVGLIRETPVTLGAAEVFEVQRIMPDASQQVFNHSPDGFAYGYPGSGPAQLALAILLDFLEDAQAALRVYRAFQSEFITTLPQHNAESDAPCPQHRIEGSKIYAWLEQREAAEVWS